MGMESTKEKRGRGLEKKEKVKEYPDGRETERFPGTDDSLCLIKAAQLLTDPWNPNEQKRSRRIELISLRKSTSYLSIMTIYTVLGDR